MNHVQDRGCKAYCKGSLRCEGFFFPHLFQLEVGAHFYREQRKKNEKQAPKAIAHLLVVHYFNIHTLVSSLPGSRRWSEIQLDLDTLCLTCP